MTRAPCDARPVPSQVLFESEALRIGAFRSRTTDHDFRDSGPTQGHVLVFPREAVTIQHADGPPIVADPSLVMIYNRGQAYTRRAISAAGDRCEWFSYPTESVLEAQIASGRRVRDEERPFGALTHVASSARTYVLARLAVESAGQDRLLTEETAATLLADVLRTPSAPTTSATHRELADSVRHWLAAHYTERCSLTQIAREHAVSMFHLARVFRSVTGQSIHRYQTELRLRAALEPLVAGEDMTEVALSLGFSSHSHFASTFRRAFGATPSQLRASKILIAARRLSAR